MMTETFYVIQSLLSAAFSECFCYVIYIAGIHQILPYDKPHFIAEIIEMIGWIIAAAPHTDAVKVGSFAGFQQIFLGFMGNSGVQTVLRNIVSASCKNFQTVDAECELTAPLIFLLTYG